MRNCFNSGLVEHSLISHNAAGQTSGYAGPSGGGIELIDVGIAGIDFVPEVREAAFDRIIAAGGFVSTHAGSAPDANALPIPKPDAEKAFDAFWNARMRAAVDSASLTAVADRNAPSMCPPTPLPASRRRGPPTSTISFSRR